MKFPKIPNLYRLAMRFPFLVVGFSILVSIASFYYAKNLKILTDFAPLLPKHTESVENLRLFEKNFGSFTHLVVTTEAPDDALAKQFLEKFAEALREHPEISYAEDRRSAEFFEKRQWLYLDLPDLQEVVRRIDRTLELEGHGVSPVFSKLMDFADENDRPDLSFEDLKLKYEKKYRGDAKAEGAAPSSLQILWVKPRLPPKDLDYNKKLMAEVKSLEAKLRQTGNFSSVQVGYTGEYQNSLEQLEQVSHEITLVSTVVTVLLLVILVLYFRRFSAAWLIGVPLACSILWTMALIYLILDHLNIITGFGTAILAGLGSDYGIFLLTRYDNERKSGRDFSTACRLAFANTGRATFGSMVTTVGAFVALLFSNFGIFVEFGVVGALGLLMNYLGMMLLLPALLVIGERWRAKNWFRKIQAWDRLPSFRKGQNSGVWLEKVFFPRKAGLGILLSLALVAAAAFTVKPQSTIYFQDGQMDNGDLPANRLNSRVSEANWGTLQPGVLLTQGEANEARTVSQLNAWIERTPESERVFHKIVGISSFVPERQAEKKLLLKSAEEKLVKARLVNPDVKAKTLRSLQDTLAAGEITPGNLPEEVQRVFRAAEKTSDYLAVLLYPSLARTTSENIDKYFQGVQKAKQSLGLDFKPVDSSFIELDIIRLIQREAPRGMILILVFFALVLLVTVRPAGRAALIYLHLLGSLVLLSGLLWLFDIPLNVMNIAMIPIVLGTGIDCFIHFSHRFDECADLSLIVREEIPAILISSLTSMVGFGGLLLTSSVGLRSVGWVVVLGLGLVTLVCALVFPRALVLQSRKWPPLLSGNEKAPGAKHAA